MKAASPTPAARRKARNAAISVLLAGSLLLLSHEKPHPGEIDLPPLPQGDIAARKQAFFEFLRPIVRHYNERIRTDRAFVRSIENKQRLSWRERRRLRPIARRYDVDIDNLEYESAMVLLRYRVDVVPPALVLIQAAKESGWGRSRFAREGNALFGEWCFSEGCGIVPAQRARGSRHEVRAFDNVHDAVGSYIDNINTHPSYRELRIARAGMRERGEKLSALELAGYLTRYSERGEAYVEEIRQMILQNGLDSD